MIAVESAGPHMEEWFWKCEYALLLLLYYFFEGEPVVNIINLLSYKLHATLAVELFCQLSSASMFEEFVC
jgi:hypothetical protein